MGFQAEIDGQVFNLEGFSATEAATPLAAGDSSGQVGTISLTLSKPDQDAFYGLSKTPQPTVVMSDLGVLATTANRWRNEANLNVFNISTARYHSRPSSIFFNLPPVNFSMSRTVSPALTIPATGVTTAKVQVFAVSAVLSQSASVRLRVTYTDATSYASPYVTVPVGAWTEVGLNYLAPGKVVDRIYVEGTRAANVSAIHVDDLYIMNQPAALPGNNLVRQFGPRMLIGKKIRLTDTRKGFTLGSVKEVSEPAGGVFSLTCESRLGELNVYGVQAAPYVGTLSGAFTYYLGLAGVTNNLFIDPYFALDPVVFPGWSGELWFNLKQIAVAMDADISLVSGVILMRPIRTRVTTTGRDTDRTSSVGGQLAQFVEVYKYNNRAITNELVYPPEGWSEEVSVINVNAKEYVEETIELSSSVSFVQQPVMTTFVARDYRASSVFTVVGDDGLPITPAAWEASGGSLEVVINPDTTSLTVKIQAPTRDLPNKSGAAIGVYSISLSSDSSTGRYSTLRIIGTGVEFRKEAVRFATGIPASRTGTEIGATIDNPFLSTTNQLYSAGTRAARQYKGQTMTLSGTVVAVNKLGDSGDATYPTYGFVKTQHAGKSYAQVKAGYAGKTYGDVQDDLFALVKDAFENQVFGNVAGARAYDRATRRWYRIRSATLNPDTIQFQADDDLTNEDIRQMIIAQPVSTYAAVKDTLRGVSYGQANLMGLFYNEGV